MQNMRVSTAILLRSAGFAVEEADSGEQAVKMLASEAYDLLLTDLKMGEGALNGLQLLEKAVTMNAQQQVIVMTGYGSIESAVQAMRLGAYDYVTKPLKEGELLHRVNRAIERGQLLNTVGLLQGEFTERHGLSSLIGTSTPMRELTARISKVATTDATVMVVGESGTGKELVARAIHTLSRRAKRPFVAVNCAAITETLLESELFGHARGSFTGAVKARRGLFEEAHGGTLFIDEVTETAPSFQTKLLRALQEGEVRRVGESVSLQVDVRTIAASNRDLERAVAEQRFRQDLYYRLAVVTLRVPPLRERLDDVPALAQHFLASANARNLRPHRLSPSALDRLVGYDFPGNVRELENLIEQAAALAEGEELTGDDFPVQKSGATTTPVPSLPTPSATGPAVSLDAVVAEAERKAISATVEKYPRDLARVASELKVSTTTLWRKMKRLGLKTSAEPPVDR